jgi:hypothetical protein
MFTIELLQKFCTRDILRPELLKPFCLTHQGGPWTAATEGWILLAVKGHLEGSQDQPKIAAHTAQLLDKLRTRFHSSPPVRVSLDVLKQWAGPAEWTITHHECKSCDNTGQITCKCCEGIGRAEGTCDHCACEIHFDCHCEDGMVDCDNCDGKGQWDEPPARRPGLLFGIFLDRNLLARAIEPLQGNEVSMSIPSDKHQALAIQDDSRAWLILVMPMCYAGEDVPRFPDNLSAEAGSKSS